MYKIGFHYILKTLQFIPGNHLDIIFSNCKTFSG